MEDLKNSKVVQTAYNLPGVKGAYHFLWAWVAAKKHSDPSEKIFVIGVTGTKGKTTTLELINAILEMAGKRTALLSSLRVKVGDESYKNPTGNSMPGHAHIQNFLHEAVSAHCRYALIEVTSQGVVQHRHKFIDWNMGILTNIHPEHIESHGSFENYRAAKLAFLKYVLAKGGKVFLNRGDKNFEFFEGALMASAKGRRAASGGSKVFSFSREDDWLRNYLPKMGATRSASGSSIPKFLLSEFNEENIAVAVAVAKELGVSDKTIEEAVLNFKGLPGRMQFVAVGPYTAIVDYAHTPESLAAAYQAAREVAAEHHGSPKLICVLGAAGGGRDKWKRPEFGKIAAEYCDEIVLTDEDPYDEDPREIIKEVRSGILGGDPDLANVYEILDRREAIKFAVGLARPGDIVIGTGKGSEDWIHAARGKKIPWNEQKIFEEELRAHSNAPRETPQAARPF